MPIETQIAYLLAQHPGASSAFLLNELTGLRSLGFTIPVASIDTPAKNLPPSEETSAEINATWYIKATPKLRVAGFCLKTLFTRPLLFFRGLYAALKVESFDPARIARALVSFAEALLLGDWLERNNRRHLHIHSSGQAAGIGRIASRAYRIPYSLTLHGPDEFANETLLHVSENIAGASFVTCISDFTRGQAMRLLPAAQWDKLHVLRLGVDPEMFVSRPARSFASPVELLCVGRLVPDKGQMLLLQALLVLVQKGLHLRLTLVGEGASRTTLEKFVASNGLADAVYLAGPLSHQETQSCLAQADIFVLPSLAEGLPVSLMEAMASQLPCVSTYVGGIPELITNELDGLLVPSSSASALAEAIERLASDPKLRARLGEAAREKVLQQYVLETSVQQLATLFAGLIPAKTS